MSKDQQRQDLERVFIKYRTRLRETAQHIVGVRDLADDVIQSAYIRLMDTPVTMQIQQVSSYCFQVVRHLAIDVRRRRILESRLFAVDEMGQSVSAPSSSPEQMAISGQHLLLVEHALIGLPHRTRLAFKLYRLDGFTQREIARQLGVSPALVNFMIRDAVDSLKECRCMVEFG